MNQYQYDHMTPCEYEYCGTECESCGECYITGCNGSWIEFKDITVDFCSTECKDHYKKECDEEIINEG